MKTKNMITREFYESFENTCKEMLKNNYSSRMDEIEKQLRYTIINSYLDEEIKNGYKILEGENYRELAVMVAMTILVLITDAFEYLRHKEKLIGLTPEEKEFFDKLHVNIVNDDFKDMLANMNILNNLVNFLKRYSQASALTKIELAKSLSEEDVKKLTVFNINFEEEYNYYNIRITEQFLLKHLNIWIKKLGIEEGIIKITKFIMNLYTLNREDFVSVAHIIVSDEKMADFIEQIKNKNLDLSAPYIRNFYDGHIDKDLSLE